jgi:hypothetical protein
MDLLTYIQNEVDKRLSASHLIQHLLDSIPDGVTKDNYISNSISLSMPKRTLNSWDRFSYKSSLTDKELDRQLELLLSDITQMTEKRKSLRKFVKLLG